MLKQVVPIPLEREPAQSPPPTPQQPRDRAAPPGRRLRRFVRNGLVGLVLVGAAWLAWQHPELMPRWGRAAPQAATAPAPVPVHAATVARHDFPVYLNGLGTAQAWNTITVRSRVDGEVMEIDFAEGQPVKAGDVLLKLDPRPFQAALDQATAKIAQDEANLVSAKADLDRTSKLVGEGYATKQLFDQQTAAVNQLNALIRADQAAEQNARVSLDYTTIRAPMSGRLGLRTIDVGNIVHAGDQNGVVTIAEIQPIAVMFTAPEDKLPAITRGVKKGPLKLIALTPDGKTTLAEGELSIISNLIDTTSGTIRLKGRFENADDALWPGLSVSTRLLVDTLHDVVVVPVGAVQRGPEGLFAYVVGPDDKAAKRDIAVTTIADGSAVVDKGLEPGERVITAGQYRVAPGALVAIAPEADAPAATTSTSALQVDHGKQ